MERSAQMFVRSLEYHESFSRGPKPDKTARSHTHPRYQVVGMINMSSLREHFDVDFPGAFGPEGPMDLQIDGKAVPNPVMWKLLFHFDSGSRFAVFYMPDH